MNKQIPKCSQPVLDAISDVLNLPVSEIHRYEDRVSNMLYRIYKTHTEYKQRYQQEREFMARQMELNV